MNTIYVILGVIAVIDVLIIVCTFMAFKIMGATNKRNEAMQLELNNLKHEISQSFGKLHRSIDDSERDAVETETKIVNYTNLRVDELESKIYKDFDMHRQQGYKY